jgi:small subunit ribosomal protein S6
VDDPGVDREIETVKKTIEDAKGEVTGVHKWGRRRLAYTIRKVNEGIYTLIRFRAEADVLRELDRRYKLNESVLRHLTIHAVGEPTLRDFRRDRRPIRPSGPGRGRGRGREGRDEGERRGRGAAVEIDGEDTDDERYEDRDSELEGTDR